MSDSTFIDFYFTLSTILRGGSANMFILISWRVCDESPHSIHGMLVKARHIQKDPRSRIVVDS